MWGSPISSVEWDSSTSGGTWAFAKAIGFGKISPSESEWVLQPDWATGECSRSLSDGLLDPIPILLSKFPSPFSSDEKNECCSSSAAVGLWSSGNKHCWINESASASATRSIAAGRIP